MKIAIHQPNFLPYLGFFDKCDYADILVLYDSTQFKKNDFQNRNRLKSGQNLWKWLTIPVSYKFGEPIVDVKISNAYDWKKKHLTMLKDCYSKTQFYENYIPKISKIYEKDWTNLSDFNIALIRFLLQELGIDTKIVLSSELRISKKSTDALVEMCKKNDAHTYISGKDGKKYLETEKFEKANIKVLFQDYNHPIYSQNFKGFEPYMSVLDLLFNEGPQSLKIIRSGRRFEYT